MWRTADHLKKAAMFYAEHQNSLTDEISSLWMLVLSKILQKHIYFQHVDMLTDSHAAKPERKTNRLVYSLSRGGNCREKGGKKEKKKSFLDYIRQASQSLQFRIFPIPTV